MGYVYLTSQLIHHPSTTCNYTHDKCTHTHTHTHTQGKTTLNNALQLHLRRINKTLEYDIIRTTHPVTRQPIFRCLVDVPYPEPFTAVGEGLTKKEAEKRGGSAACLKLLVSEWVGVSLWWICRCLQISFPDHFQGSLGMRLSLLPFCTILSDRRIGLQGRHAFL